MIIIIIIVVVNSFSFFVDKIFYCVIEILTDAMQAANDIVPCF